MENNHSENSNNTKQKQQGTGVAYPVTDIEEALAAADQIVANHGSGKPISKEEISKTLNKKVGTLNLFFSTLVQYGIFNLVHGKGYMPSDLYRRYRNPHDENDPFRTRLMMFQNAPLYNKIIEHLNNHQLPANEKMFANRLKEAPYNVSENAADRASRVFFENARALNLLNGNNTLRFSLSQEQPPAAKHEEAKNPPADQTPLKPPPAPPKDDTLFEMPIPLPNKRIAYLHYPLDDLTKKDVRVIQKALEFIASSIDDGDEP